MKLSEIIIYPIKALGGIHLENCLVEGQGLQYDRRMMLIDRNNQFLTQRAIPELALFKCQLSNRGIQVEYNDSSILIRFSDYMAERIEVQIWEDLVNAVAMNKHLDAWFSDQLGRYCRLVTMDNRSIRPVDPRYANKSNDVSFADGFPVLLVNTASLKDLNARLTSPISMSRFRPNLVIEADDSFAEDSWDDFQIGEVHFKAVKPCARCQVITIDQLTAERSKEPLQTLSKYRQKENKVMFGQNLLVLHEGIIKKGDPLQIFSHKQID